jgi:ATP-dependent DNA helicase RecG
MAFSVDTPVQYVKGVGPKLGVLLKKKGIETLRDLLEFYPRAYEDRRAARSIASLKDGDFVGLQAEVARATAIPMGRTGRKIYDISIRDASGLIHCKFFRIPFRGYFDKFQPGMKVRVVGKVILYRNQLEFHHPELHEWTEEEVSGDRDELLPIYSETEGLSSKKLQAIIRAALAALELPKNLSLDIEKDPDWLRKKYNLATYAESIYRIHVPEAGMGQSYLDRQTPYHRRLIFDEFFMLELILASRKKGMQNENAPPIPVNTAIESKFLKSLPFELTNAQKKVILEVQKDMALARPMNRLVQGDVGSGKTMVALITALSALANGYQVAMMAPTEILAQQHALNAEKFLKPLGIQVGFLSGQLKGKDKAQSLEDLASGKTQFVVGTHALIQEGVAFHNLGYVVVDEQHRFGVQQRSMLKGKGRSPHFLLMTATPIPRSLAMTVYGDLDASIINELPKGRQAIVTRATYQSKRVQVLQFLQEQLQQGRQAYIVFPLVEESEKIDLKSATNEFEKLQNDLPKYRLGLLHGKMKAEEKDKIMESFRKHEIDVLVSTTVIEVGVDVPNANIMWVEHAERFGLSQLHQLRGRVGRGEYKSYCILMMGYAVSPEAQDRVRFLETTNDGFKVSEYDLEIRGPGEFLGVRQSGMPGFKMANLVRDLPILEEARQAAFELLDRDPKLAQKQHESIRALMQHSQKSLA